jgi:hypothetical protein
VTGPSARWTRPEGPPQAILVDVYLDALLASGERRAGDVPADATLDPETRRATLRLRRDLTRFHPSFRFEERLSARLAELAAQMRLPAAAGGEGMPLPTPIGIRGLPDAELQAIVDGRLDPSAPDSSPIPRQVLIRGAVASAAVGLAGVAIVAWKVTRPPAPPMVRAVRAARRVRALTPGVRRQAPAWRRAGRLERPS